MTNAKAKASSPPFLRNLASLKAFGSDSVRAAAPSRSVETNKKNLVGSSQQQHLFAATCWPEICHLIKQRPAQSERSDATLGPIGSKKAAFSEDTFYSFQRKELIIFPREGMAVLMDRIYK